MPKVTPRPRTRDEIVNIMIECDCSEESARIIQGFRWDIEDAEKEIGTKKSELCAFYAKHLGETRMQAAD